ncbi:MAG: 2,4-dihydroxyhept-2-ene,7-dioic acid aldolase [Microbacteriaceae bacterium]|jgi:4-hydroxy-2-oxoheptanedioate aldolase|nr:2,4-dihydroxyhept-2-ene,7-dioic acid aldolase [Microbacteriaceae bacterium]
MTDRFLDRGTVKVGLWVKLPLVESIELASIARYDFVVIDLEHSTISTETAALQIAMARALGVLSLVRLPLSARSDVGRLLDAGAGGIVFPHVETAADAAEAVRLSRFPPLGERGAGPTSRAGLWGVGDLEDYLSSDGRPPFLIVQIETSEAVANVESIGATPGVDALLVGQLDLAVSLGESNSPELLERLLAEFEASSSSGIALGTAVGTSAAVDPQLSSRGYRFVVVSNDASLLASAAVTSVTAARARLSERQGSEAD